MSNFFAQLASTLSESFGQWAENLVSEPHEELELHRARWGELEKSKLSPYNTSFRFGDYAIDEQTSTRHAVIISPSGGKKTVTCVLPELLSAPSNGYGSTFIIHDESKEIFNNVSGHLLRSGYRIYVIDPNNSVNSHRYNPLSLMGNDTSEINKIAHLLMSSTASGSSDKFWTNSAESLLSLLIEIVLQFDVKERNIGSVLKLAHLLGSNPKEVDEIVSKLNNDEIYRSYAYQISISEKTFSGILQSVVSSLTLYESPTVREVVSEHDIPIDEIRKYPTAIFLFNSLHDSKFISTFLGIVIHGITKELMKAIPSKNSRPVHFILDETSTISHAIGEDLGMLLSNSRKYGLSFLLVIQGIDSLRANFRDHVTILNNCYTKLFFGGINLDTSEMVSKMLGNQTIELGNGQQKIAPLMSPEQVRTMSDTIILFGDQLPIKVKLRPFFEQSKLLFRSKYPPAPFRMRYNR